MSTKFDLLFDQWAGSYDRTVSGHDEEYKAVFAGYDDILTNVADRAEATVLEFGVGTGNLTKKLLSRGHRVYGVEPSREMRKKAREKLPQIALFEGDFLHFPSFDETIHSIVSTYAFHHLTDEEKGEAIGRFRDLLPTGGKVVFADTVFETDKAKQDMIETVERQGYRNLLKDLQSEYYTTIPVLRRLFVENGFSEATFSQLNQFVWLIEAVKK